MSELDFLIISVAEWRTLAALTLIFATLLFFSTRRIIVGGIFDPLTLVLTVGYSVNYAVVALLYINGNISSYLTFLVFGYGLTLMCVFFWASQRPGKSKIITAIRAITPRSIGMSAFAISLAIYLLLSFFIIASIGFGIFAETNRFNAARGFGAYIRLLDFLGPFIISYGALNICYCKSGRKKKTTLLAMFILYAAMVNGAKISIIFSLFTVFFTMTIARVNIKIKPTFALISLVVGLVFSVLALSINLRGNNVEESTEATDLAGAGIVIERFIYRVIASGDSSYLLLPNAIIDTINTDSILVRFVSPIIGITASSKIFGYEVGDFSVGRQALLTYDPSNDVSGGPTSHFDLFAYVYFGPLGGWVFVICLGLLLGSISRAIRVAKGMQTTLTNKYQIAFLATLWTRAVLVIIEPTVAIAYIIDVIVYFTLLSVALQPALRSPARALSSLTVRQLPAV